MWTKFSFPPIWIIGVDISIDEITIHFKVYRAETIRMRFKAEGDGLQADDICEK